ncbi:hypothetical protein T484DRAFT_1862557 [Baffinella frigidus]|nr:hypothetical protein T484DRAFT_1862557 [Cryptophyta sp. CCMP2293]
MENVSKLWHDRQSAQTDDTVAIGELTLKLEAALEETKLQQGRLEALRAANVLEKKQSADISKHNISGLEERLRDAQEQNRSITEDAKEYVKDYSESRDATELAHKDRFEKLLQEISDAHGDTARWKERVHKLEQTSMQEAAEKDTSDNARVDKLQEELDGATSALAQYKVRYLALHAEGLKHRNRADDLLRVHEEFVEKSNRQSEILMQALTDEESKSAEATARQMERAPAAEDSVPPSLYNNIRTGSEQRAASPAIGTESNIDEGIHASIVREVMLLLSNM